MRQSLFRTVIVLSVVLAFASCGSEDNPCKPPPRVYNPVVVIETSLGDITVELNARLAPITVGNFLTYMHEGYYDSLTFHRVIQGFIIQGGGYDENMQTRPTYEPIPNEAANGLSNIRFSIAMARSIEPHSATSQFFINLRDNKALDFSEKTPRGWGYCVFGKVVEGMDVVDDIGSVETTTRNGFNDVPVEPVILIKLYRSN